MNVSEAGAAADRLKRVRDAVELPLRSASQLVFQDHPLSGVLFLAGAFAGSATMGLAALLGLVSGALTALVAGADRDLVRSGFFGFNGFYFGLGLAYFLGTGPVVWLSIVLGAAFTTIVTLAVAHLLKPWNLPVLTAPFILVLWTILLAGIGSEGIAAAPASTAEGSQPLGAWEQAGIPAFVASSALRSAGQIFFLDSTAAGALILGGVAIGSRPAAAMAALGAVCGVATALALGADKVLIQQGIYGYNACLCAVAVGCVFFGVSARSVALGLLAACAATILTPVFAALLGGWRLPVVSLPFTLATWIFLLAERGRSGAVT